MSRSLRAAMRPAHENSRERRLRPAQPPVGHEWADSQTKHVRVELDAIRTIVYEVNTQERRLHGQCDQELRATASRYHDAAGPVADAERRREAQGARRGLLAVTPWGVADARVWRALRA